MYSKKIFRTAIFVFLILLFLISIKFMDKTFLLSSMPLEDFSSNWTHNGEKIQLDNQLVNIIPGEDFIISNTIPVDIKKNQELLIRSSLSNIKISIDNTKVYEVITDRSGIIKEPFASLWNIVKIPDNSNGKKIEITFMSPYKKLNGLANPIYYGSHGNILLNILKKYQAVIIIDTLILLFGILMCFISFTLPEKSSKSLWYIGIFAFLSFLWLLSESRLLQFLTGDRWIIGSTAYITLAIIPYPLIKYIENIVNESHSKFLNKFSLLTWINLLLIILLQIFGVIDFFETLPLTHGYIFLSILIFFVIVISEIKNHDNNHAKHFLISLGVMFIFIVAELIRFHLYDLDDVTMMVQLGLLSFIAMLGYDMVKRTIRYVKNSYHAEFYKNLAHTDPLTKGYNRMAFEKDLNEIFDKKSFDNLRLMFLDMNHLKKINDEFGHHSGDEALKTAHTIIKDSFSDIGQTYRIGGDEFAVILNDVNKLDYNRFCDNFYSKIKEEDSISNYEFGISWGCVKFDPVIDLSPNTLIQRADQNMYFEKNKRRL